MKAIGTSITDVATVPMDFFFQVTFFEKINTPTEERSRASAKKPTKYHFGVVKKSWVSGRKKTTTNNANTDRT